ncbi:MAG: GAF domain-containing protein, partial [Robiginitomaculum sp.]|nr:GAF domain-containing protein [Robiginitomaculum sp.]
MDTVHKKEKQQKTASKQEITNSDPQVLLEIAQGKLQQAEMLLGVARRTAAIEKLDDVLAVLVAIATEEIGAERGTLLLNDPQSNELYSRVAQGNLSREIRILNNTGIAGAVFTSGVGEIIDDPYHDDRFNRSVDGQTGFKTKAILCTPLKTMTGEVIGVTQVLNPTSGTFTQDDLELLEAITMQASAALQSTQYIERVEKNRKKEMEFLDLVADITSELELGPLLTRVMSEATRMLQADRSTLFLNDEKTGELFSRVAMGDKLGEIRLPNTAGIAGAVFTSGKSIHIPHAYADLRFNPSFDKQTGYFTRSILCVPVLNKNGKRIGVTQVLNKKSGSFTEEDESRLKAFTAQVSIALENASLFESIQNMQNYSQGMLQSMSNGVLTLNEEGVIITCNRAGLKIFGVKEEDVINVEGTSFFAENAWIMDLCFKVEGDSIPEVVMDRELIFGERKINANVSVLPLNDSEGKTLGDLLMIEDISAEKRMKSTMSRYMDPTIAAQLMSDGTGESLLGGKSSEATILFSDIRSFTTITESLGAEGTVQMLNEYFTIMVDCITREGGMLDKFIGDAIMAGFGIPLAHDDDEDRAVRTAISMITELWDWNIIRVKNGLDPIDHGIGLNTGMVVSGNIGSPKRMDYTMIGDGVNLAARLESACKQYNAGILISEFTRKKLKGTYRLRDVDMVVVKGKTKPVGVFEVLDYHTEDTFPNLMDNVNYFNSGVSQYRTGNWSKAISQFDQALKATPSDKLSNIYIDRCHHLQTKN